MTYLFPTRCHRRFAAIAFAAGTFALVGCQNNGSGTSSWPGVLPKSAAHLPSAAAAPSYSPMPYSVSGYANTQITGIDNNTGSGAGMR